MDIYVVKKGDTVESIGKMFGMDSNKIIQDNGLRYPHNLIIGQAIVIAYPEQTHVVQEGENLSSIAEAYGISVMQLLRNNPFLSDRDFIYPGETLTISYNTIRPISTMGYTYPFVDMKILIKTLPELTCLSIINYTSTERGEIIEYRDDSKIISSAKAYGTIPLMLSTTLSPIGTPNLSVAQSILTNENYQNVNIEESIKIIKRKGYGGMNVVFNYLNKENESRYIVFATKISKRFREEGLLFYLTINYVEYLVGDEISYDKVVYSNFSTLADDVIFLKFKWGSFYDPPAPVANLTNMRKLVSYVVTEIPSDMVDIGIPLLGYDWQLPYVPEESSASSLSIDSVLELAQEVGALIQFDEVSQTPFFEYFQHVLGDSYPHIIWFVDARSIQGVTKLIIDYQLNGKGVWNIMQYNAPVWTVINATFDIIKLI